MVKRELILLTAHAVEQGFSNDTVNLLVDQLTQLRKSEGSETERRVRAVLHEGGTVNKINAIKEYRTLTGSALKDAKDWVEQTFNV